MVAGFDRLTWREAFTMLTSNNSVWSASSAILYRYQISLSHFFNFRIMLFICTRTSISLAKWPRLAASMKSGTFEAAPPVLGVYAKQGATPPPLPCGFIWRFVTREVERPDRDQV